MKRLVILCDGTWNSPDQAQSGTPVPTNVVKLAEAILATSDGVAQLLYYNPGIGSSGSYLTRLYQGATGKGISVNIQEAYRFVVRSFLPGDELYLFGFSRGAFTARSLAGLIRNCGVLRKELVDLVPQAYALYRSRDPATHPKAREATLFRRTYALEDITPVHFIGVWDTVGSLGNPLYLGRLSPGNRFHDTALGTHVKHAYHALAVDDLRRNFTPTLWHQQPGAEGQVLEQRWFPGTHSNVGGGYPDAHLSDLALQWLASKASGAGLGLSALKLDPNPCGNLVNSRTGLYLLIPRRRRSIGMSGSEGPTRETVDESLLSRRLSLPRYRPRNLEDFLRRNPQVLAGAVSDTEQAGR